MSVESPQGLTKEDVMDALRELSVDLLYKMHGEPREKVTAVLRAVRADYLRFAATKPSRDAYLNGEGPNPSSPEVKAPASKSKKAE